MRTLSIAFLLAACAEPLHRGIDWSPASRASETFWETWGDGRAELASYRGTVSRYGERREAELVLVTVTEPADGATLIKDDDAAHPIQVLKLNAMLRFQTGIYPYTVMTTVSAPTDGYFSERFAPARITLSAQEWCGHTWLGVWPGRAGEARVHGLSYFPEEGERTATMISGDALFEDALLLQVRELDGPFLGGAAHADLTLVPSLWSSRRDHEALTPRAATMDRGPGEPYESQPTSRFTFRYGGERRLEIDVDGAHRITRIAENEEVLILSGVTRLPYWELNHEGDERHRAELGLPVTAFTLAD